MSITDSIKMMFKALLLLFASGLVCQTASGSVLVELYYESLCPYCKEFINDQLFPTYKKLENTGEAVQTSLRLSCFF